MRTFAFVLLVFAAALPVRSGQGIDVHDAWIRYTPGDRPMAGYLIMDNTGEEERRLVGASSEAFGAVHIHETVERDGTKSMQPVESVAVPAGGSATLQPGGHHLMLMQRQREIEVGDEVMVSLQFDDGASATVQFTVKPTWQE